MDIHGQETDSGSRGIARLQQVAGPERRVLLPLYVKRRANNGRSVTSDPEEPRRQIIVAVLMKARRQFTFIPDDSLANAVLSTRKNAKFDGFPRRSRVN